MMLEWIDLLTAVIVLITVIIKYKIVKKKNDNN